MGSETRKANYILTRRTRLWLMDDVAINIDIFDLGMVKKFEQLVIRGYSIHLKFATETIIGMFGR